MYRGRWGWQRNSKTKKNYEADCIGLFGSSTCLKLTLYKIVGHELVDVIITSALSLSQWQYREAMTRNFVKRSKLNFDFKRICKCLFNRGKTGVRSLGSGVCNSNTVCPCFHVARTQKFPAAYANTPQFSQKTFCFLCAPFCLKWKFKNSNWDHFCKKKWCFPEYTSFL